MPFSATAIFPSAIAGVGSLFNQKNYLLGETFPPLALPMGVSDSSFSLISGTGSALPTDNFLATIDAEIIFVSARSGDSCTGLVRAMEGTTAAMHSAGALVNAFITALQHNQLAAEINAIETQLGANLVNVFNASNLNSGLLGLKYGGTEANLSGTGGASQVLKQISSGAAITVGQLSFVDISGVLTTAQEPSTTVNSVSNDTNVTGTIGTQTLSLGWTGQLSLSRGGTNSNLSGTGGSNQVLQQSSLGGAITVAQLGFTNLSGSIALAQTPLANLGDTLYVNSVPALAALAGNTTGTKLFLTQTGTGLISAAPVWASLTTSDLPALNLAPAPSSITNTQLTSNVATYTCANNFLPGQLATITGLVHNPAVYNIVLQPIVSATSAQFTVAITHANIASTADSGSAQVPIMDFRTNAGQLVNSTPFVISDSNGLPLLWVNSPETSGVDGSPQQLNFQGTATNTFISVNPKGGGGGGFAINGSPFVFNGASPLVFSGNGSGIQIWHVAPSGTRTHLFNTGASATQATFDMAQFTSVALAAPGAGFGRLEWLAGTVGGLKLVGFAGTSTVGSTIIDNVGNGRNEIESSVAYVDLTAQTAAVGTTTLYAVPAAGAGQYRLSWNAKVTTAATTGAATSTLGALTITYVDPDGVTQTVTCAANSKSGTQETTDSGNSTTTVLLGDPILINSASSQNITYAMAYASNTANQMAYNLHLRLESL